MRGRHAEDEEDQNSEATWSENDSDCDSHSGSQMDGVDNLQPQEVIRYVGPITETLRLAKVRHYLKKKYNKAFSKKYTYTCRKQVAEKRLRIKGRFVTKDQAYEILGLT